MTERFRATAACPIVGLLICCLCWPAMADEAAAVGPATSSDPAPSLNPMTAVGRATLKGFLERPLFDPSRRLPAAVAPVVIDTTPVAAPPEPPPSLQLLGVIHGSRDMAVARRQGDEKTIILRTGDRISGWTVAIQPPTGLELKNGRRTFDYVLFGKSGDVQPAADPDGASGTLPDRSDELSARTNRLQKRTY